MTTAIEKLNIRLVPEEELRAWFKERGHPKYRFAQVKEWLWQKSILDFDEMTNLSKALREDLKTHFVIPTISIDTLQRSDDGTIKVRFELHDGHKIEAVLIPVTVDNRYTVCVSTQVGCSLTCKFCATGLMKRERNLDAYEIVDQVVEMRKICEERYYHTITNIVYMGMGEPLLAYRPVMESIDRITLPDGLGMSPKRLTVSTAGIAKMIHKMADEGTKVNLALSLHAADDKKRNEIMPINEQNNLEVLMDSLRYFYRHTKGKISYEYIAFQGFNDGVDDARKLIKLCKDFPVRVNIIEYNPVEGLKFTKSQEDTLDTFMQTLQKEKVRVTLRRSRGKDIDAACGQLANKES